LFGNKVVARYDILDFLVDETGCGWLDSDRDARSVLRFSRLFTLFAPPMSSKAYP